MGVQSHAGERGAESTRNGPVFVPVTDIYETEQALFLALEMPGVDPAEVSITLDKRVLTISGRSHVHAPEGCSLSHHEYRDGDYERSFTLAESIDGDHIEAELKDGLLRLKLPKAQPAPAKSIHVKAV
ncbi:MAG: Hsp20/alpha crystallin family protein [Defluviicoccus sp.]|nr:MAG: Hsp20/alpha crystallin family protein [Defluviicoccus sp.]